MAETTYFWQGGRRIAIHKDERAITLHADSEADAQNAASRAGVHLHALQRATPSLIRGRVIITAAAADQHGVAKVRLYVAGRLVATDFTAPYALPWQSAPLNKPVPVDLRATDRAGNVTSVRRWMRAKNAVPRGR